jgi:uncharacterized protein (DUF169 family)
MNMSARIRDYSIFNKFNFERKPVGVSYSLRKPAGIQQLEKSLAICELFKEAQTSRPFYATKENIQCGTQVVGMDDFPPVMYSGQLGSEFSMFKTPSANRRVYDYVRVLPKDSVKYIVHSSLDQIAFDPDLLIITANTAQAEVLLRASSFSSGNMWTARGSTCLACAWIYAYPYLSGELNYNISGLGFSMKARQVLPDGLFIITIPCEMISMIIENLHDMKWEPHWFNLGRDGFVKGVKDMEGRISKEFPPDMVWNK